MRKLPASLEIILSLLFAISLWAAVPDDHVKYDIWVDLDAENQMLTGQQTIQWVNKSNDAITDMYFHLYWNAFKNENSAFLSEAIEDGSGMGNRVGNLKKPHDAGWIDVISVRVVNGPDLTHTIEFVNTDLPERPGDQTVMKITLDHPLLRGESVYLIMEFKAKIPRTIARSGYYQNSYFIGQWFPKPGVYEPGKGWNCHQYHYTGEFFADFAEFMVHITVPAEFVVGASGRLISEISHEQSNSVTYTYWQDHIHDFAWTADPDYIRYEGRFIANQFVSDEEYRKYAEIFELPVESIKLPDVDMILLIRKEHADQAERHFAALEQAIKYYGLFFGPYPYETITMIDPPFRTGSDGMEYPTLFVAGTAVFTSELDMMCENVIIHEFGHNYWYGMVANNEFEEAWLDEGLNTYSEMKVQDLAYGCSQFIPRFFNWPFTRYFKDFKYYMWEYYRFGGIFSTGKDPVVKPSWLFYDNMSYFMNTYFRAGTLLLTLENILGEKVMMQTMRTFQENYRFTHPSTRDFINTVNQVSQRDMTWFFDEMFFQSNDFDYGIGSVYSEPVSPARGIFDTDSGKTVIDDIGDQPDSLRKYLTIVKVRRFGAARLGGDELLRIDFIFEDSTKETRYWDGRERWCDFRFVTSSPLALAHVDPDMKYLIDTSLINNSYRVEAKSSGVVRWANKLMFWIQNIMQLITLFS